MKECKEDGSYPCGMCHNRGKVVTRTLDMYEICPECDGMGRRTWLDMVFSAKPAIDYSREISMQNLRMLHDTIIDYGYQIGLKIKIDIQVDAGRDEYIRSTPSIIYHPPKEIK